MGAPPGVGGAGGGAPQAGAAGTAAVPASWDYPYPPDQKGSTKGAAAQEQRGAKFDVRKLSPNIFAAAVAARKNYVESICDKMGRITTSQDHHTCDDDDVCVTALPADFCKRLGDPPYGAEFCYKWVTPECPPPEPCPPPCPGPPPCPPGAKVCPKAPPCPKPAPCPPPTPCPEPHWEDQAQVNKGHPWCVKAVDLEKYGGPIEVACAASGPRARMVGSPTGCWVLQKATHESIQRLPGKIKVPASWLPPGAESEVYVKDGPGVDALDMKRAEHWVVNGSLGKLPNGGRRGAEFLA